MTQTVLMAGPEKSICDKIITTAGVQLRSRKQALEFLEEDLRIDRESLRNLDLREMSGWLTDCPKADSIKNVIESVQRLNRLSDLLRNSPSQTNHDSFRTMS